MEIAVKKLLDFAFLFFVYSGDFFKILKWLDEYLAFKDIFKLHVFYHALNVSCLKERNIFNTDTK